MTTPSPDAFAALARSSPWRWTTLRFTMRMRREGAWQEPARAWLRRPDLLRVETPDGGLLQIVHQRPERVFELTIVSGGDSGGGSGSRDLPWPDASDAPAPVWRPDGLVAERASGTAVSYDAPMYRDYFWVAMLDPVELADGRDPDTGARRPGAAVASVAELEHAGRPAWEAVLRPTPGYQPRCACCALLWSRESDLIEYGPDGLRDDYPEAYRVRLDVGTGVCVVTEALDGSPRGDGHELVIEAVDEPMDDGLF